MKKDKRYKHFEVPILNDTYKVYVYIGDKLKTNNAINKYLGEEDTNYVFEEKLRGRCIYRRGYHPCIWIDGTLDYKSAVGTLCHEAIHGVSNVMDYLSMDMRDTSGNEFLAHSVGAIIRTCLEKSKG